LHVDFAHNWGFSFSKLGLLLIEDLIMYVGVELGIGLCYGTNEGKI